MISAVHNPSVSDLEAPLTAALLLTLEEMIKGYQHLLTVLQREKELMIEGNVNDLMVCLTEKEKRLGELRRLEATRCRQAMSLDPSAPMPTFLQLMDRIPYSYRERFSSCYDRLRALTASVVDLNQINGLLGTRILQHVHTLLGLLTHLSETPLYQASGALHTGFQNGTKKPSLFYFQG